MFNKKLKMKEFENKIYELEGIVKENKIKLFELKYPKGEIKWYTEINFFGESSYLCYKDIYKNEIKEIIIYCNPKTTTEYAIINIKGSKYIYIKENDDIRVYLVDMEQGVTKEIYVPYLPDGNIKFKKLTESIIKMT